jgi:hypothetical protein
MTASSPVGEMRSAERVATVLSGGGARGAQEAGAISILAPALESRGERPSLLIGTSVGAINAAYLAASRRLDAEEEAAGLLDRWPQVTKDKVIRPTLRHQLPLTMLRYAGELLSLPRARLASLLDPAPLERNLARWIDWHDLHRNVAHGRGDRGGRYRRARGKDGCIRGRASRTGAPPLPRRRVRAHPARGRTRAGFGRDPDPVPARPGRYSGRRPRLVRGWRHSAEHADQAGRSTSAPSD